MWQDPPPQISTVGVSQGSCTTEAGLEEGRRHKLELHVTILPSFPGLWGLTVQEGREGGPISP